MPQQTELPLEERTENLAQFLTPLAYQQTGGVVNIAVNDNAVNILLDVDPEKGFTLPKDQETLNKAWQILNWFDVFSEYASKGYDFNIILCDEEGKELGRASLPSQGCAEANEAIRKVLEK